MTNTFGHGSDGGFAEYHPVVGEENEGDRLYGLALEEFTQARDALAARLRSAGDAHEAARVKALRKPTTPAWAVDQLARRQRPLIEQLIEAVDRLREAQHRLLQGGPAQAVWEATLAERDTLARLSHEAERILAGASYGVTRGMLDRISDTLAAAAADDDARELLRRGVLTQEMRRAGFGEILGMPAPAAPPRDRPAPARKAATVARPLAKKKSAKEPGPTPKQVLDAEREAKRLTREAERAETDSERSQRALERVEEEVASARRRLAVLEKDLARARLDAEDARKSATSARRDASKATDRLDRLRGTKRR